MDTNSSEAKKGSPQNDEGIQFTVPEKTTSVTAKPPTQSTTPGNHDKELFDVERAFSGDSVQKGTIVSDHKRTHTGATNLLASAWNEWWQKTQHSTRKFFAQLEHNPFFAKDTGVAIPPPETRQHIIHAATSQGAQAPRDDHALVKEKIRTSSEQTSVEPVSKFAIKSGAEQKKPQWVSEEKIAPSTSKSVPQEHSLPPPHTVKNEFTPKTTTSPIFSKKVVLTSRDEGTIDLREVPSKGNTIHTSTKSTPPTSGGWAHFMDTADSNDFPEASHSTTVPSAAPKQPQPLIPQPSPVSAPQVTREALPQSKPVPVELSAFHTTPQPTPVTPRVVPPPNVALENKRPTVSVPGETKVNSAQSNTSTSIEQFTTQENFLMHIPRKFLLGIVVIIGMTAGALVALRAFTNETSNAPETPITSHTDIPLLRMEKSVPIPFSTGTNTLLDILAARIQGGGEDSEVFKLTVPGEVSRTASVTEFVDIFGENMPSGLKRSLLPSYAIGVLRKGVAAPFIVLTSPEYERAFSGMLMWEQSLSEDLSPFFGSPVNNTISSQKGSTGETPQFIDAIDGGTPIRILYDELGNERIVYAIVNKERILITTTTEALATLISELN